MSLSTDAAPQATGDRPRLRFRAEEDLVPPLALILAWLGLVAAIDPRGDFSLNDDWAYGLPVRALVEAGQLRFTFWQSMTLIAQVFWGALFCLPAGFSFDALRVSTLVAGLGGVLALYGLLRHYRADRTAALIGALAFAVNPLYLGVSCTFMTDIPFTALMIFSVLALARGLDSGRDRAVWTGLAAAFAALFIRQLALAAFLGFLIASPLKYGFGRRWLIRGVLPLLIAVASLWCFSRLLDMSGRLPGFYYLKAGTLKLVLVDLLHLHPGALKPALSAALMMMMFAGMLASPWLALLGPSLIGRGAPAARRVRLGWVIGFTVLATAALAATGRLMPMTGNIMGDFKMGILSLTGQPPRGPPKAFWIVVTAVASAGASILLLIVLELVAAIASRRTDPETADRRCHAVFLIAVGVLYFGPLGLPYQLMLDRYVLLILALFMALALKVPGIERRRPPAAAVAASLVLTAALAGYSVATIHDYFAWQRASWTACLDLMDNRGIPPDEINGGFEFNNQLPNWRGIYTTSVKGDLVADADSRPYSVAYSERPGHELIGRRGCATWLPYSPREILVLRRTATAPDGR
ncbi:MAG TPA: glycosyltransferase family 39 protein [Isosphaeraceae bacterium]|nr:glycosyltransferase family 39 protein [Isosphaeraceae bacterium]